MEDFKEPVLTFGLPLTDENWLVCKLSRKYEVSMHLAPLL